MTGGSGRKQKLLLLGSVSLVLAGILLFALFIHHPWPAKTMGLAGLLASAVLVGRSLSFSSCLPLLGLGFPDRRASMYGLAAVILGLALGIFTRLHFKLGLLPGTLTLVAVTASLTGAMEEVLFRGYIQGSLIPVHGIFALVYAALAHTAYKVLVLYSLGRPLEFDFLFLAQWTLIGGILFGLLRWLSQSVYPPLIAHVLFDILVYGEALTAPFWVWN